MIDDAGQNDVSERGDAPIGKFSSPQQSPRPLLRAVEQGNDANVLAYDLVDFEVGLNTAKFENLSDAD